MAMMIIVMMVIEMIIMNVRTMVVARGEADLILAIPRSLNDAGGNDNDDYDDDDDNDGGVME